MLVDFFYKRNFTRFGEITKGFEIRGPTQMIKALGHEKAMLMSKKLASVLVNRLLPIGKLTFCLQLYVNTKCSKSKR